MALVVFKRKRFRFAQGEKSWKSLSIVLKDDGWSCSWLSNELKDHSLWRKWWQMMKPNENEEGWTEKDCLPLFFFYFCMKLEKLKTSSSLLSIFTGFWSFGDEERKKILPSFLVLGRSQYHFLKPSKTFVQNLKN